MAATSTAASTTTTCGCSERGRIDEPAKQGRLGHIDKQAALASLELDAEYAALACRPLRRLGDAQPVTARG